MNCSIPISRGPFQLFAKICPLKCPLGLLQFAFGARILPITSILEIVKSIHMEKREKGYDERVQTIVERIKDDR